MYKNKPKKKYIYFITNNNNKKTNKNYNSITQILTNILIKMENVTIKPKY